MKFQIKLKYQMRKKFIQKRERYQIKKYQKWKVIP